MQRAWQEPPAVWLTPFLWKNGVDHIMLHTQCGQDRCLKAPDKAGLWMPVNVEVLAAQREGIVSKKMETSVLGL